MTKLLGANWRTTVSGIGTAITTFLFALSTISLTPEAQTVIGFLSPEQKKTVAIGSALAALAFRFWNSVVQKDRNVTGGTTQQTASGAVAAGVIPSSAVADTRQARPQN